MDRKRAEIDVRHLKRAVYGPVVVAFLVLIALVWLDEALDVPFLIYRTSQTAPGWIEALEETLLIFTIAFFTIAALRAGLNRLIDGTR
ncbi:MAG: hypothetical protein V1789_03065 [PVC group bacterium]